MSDRPRRRSAAKPPPGPADAPPPYRVYRSRRRLFGGDDRSPLEDLHAREPRERSGGRGRAGSSPPQAPRRRRRLTWRRGIAYLLLAVIGWLALSLVLFLVSAQLGRGGLPGDAGSALRGAGYPLTSANTVLVLGSDLRAPGTREPGAATTGPSRSDSIMLMRVGAGHNARLSIPRDTVVDIPGHGRDKINAAYAYGGSALAVRTIEQYLGIPVNHVIDVDFANFPKLIDALGGIDYTGGCVVSLLNGGFRNGGYTLRLKAGTTHIDGRQALALARTRKNLCNPRESDLTRALRQQKILSAMKARLLSPGAFIRLPWIAWEAPRALRTDMGGPTLLGLFGAMATTGSPPTRILRPSGGVTLPNGGAGLVVSDAEKQVAVQRFLNG
jgi:LCP family protein required for cell wall assembly